MAEIEIAIGRSRYVIQCQESEKEKLNIAAERLNERVNNLSLSFRNLDDQTLLAISALVIEEELMSLESTQQSTNTNPAPAQEKENNKISEKDVYEAVSENMENIAGYLENLTKKIRNY